MKDQRCEESSETPPSQAIPSATFSSRRPAVTERLIPRVAEPAAGLDTPLLPPSLLTPIDSRATLTVLTGLHAGRLLVVGSAPVTIGRAPDADLFIDDAGLSRYHTRITRAPASGYLAEDLDSTNGTFSRTGRIHVAPVQSGDILRLGPHSRCVSPS